MLLQSIANQNYGQNVQNNLYFGKKYPTRQILELATGRPIRNGSFMNNVKTINKLANDKNFDIINAGSTGCCRVFDSVGEMLREKLPQLQPYINRISCVLSYHKDLKSCKEDVKTILDSAAKEFGKYIEVPTEEIEKFLSTFL